MHQCVPLVSQILLLGIRQLSVHFGVLLVAQAYFIKPKVIVSFPALVSEWNFQLLDLTMFIFYLSPQIEFIYGSIREPHKDHSQCL